MNVEEALLILDTALEQNFLNDVQELVFRQSWLGQTYLEMAKGAGYNSNYIKDVGYKLWKLLSEVFEEEVTKSNFRSVLRRQYINFPNTCHWQRGAEIETPNDYAENNIFVHVGVNEAKNTASTKQIEEFQQEIVANTVLATSLESEKVNLNNQNPNTNLLKKTPELINAEEITTNTSEDWRKVIDIADLYGRTTEIDTLKQWITDNRCRLVAVFGMESIGKPAVSYAPSD